MNDNNSNITVIAYHDNCIDGFTAAWVAYRELKCQYRGKDVLIDLFPMKYDDESYDSLDEYIGKNDPIELYVVDFSLPIESLQSFQHHKPDMNVTIIDHHKTAFERYCDEEWGENSSLITELHGANIILDMKECGASLTYQFFNGDAELPTLIKYVKDYDLWQFNLGEETKWINAYLRTRDQHIMEWDRMYKWMEHLDTRKMMFDSGMKLVNAHNRTCAIIADMATTLVIPNHAPGLYVSCEPQYASSVGHILAVRSGTYGATFWPDTVRGVINWSLRSEGDFDVSEIAKAFGGGGHKNAAGFKTTILPEGVLHG